MTTPIASISGLITGIDTSGLIDAIIAQDSAPMNALQAQQTAIGTQETELGNFKALLTALQTATQALDTGDALSSTAASTSILTGTTVLANATSDDTAVPSSYTLQVSQLAAAEKLASTATVANATTALNDTGSFTINGQTVNVTSSDTLSSLRDKINALDSGSNPTHVTASILTVSPTDSRLILTSDVSGSAGISLADTSGTTLQSLGFLDGTGKIPTAAVLVAGADADFSIDGIALTRSSNTVTDAIAGVTLNLTAADPTGTDQTTITVGRDANAATTAIQNFVTAYNAVIQYVQAQGTVTQNSDGTTTVPTLYGDSLIRGIRSSLPQTLLAGAFGASASLPTLANAGLELQEDGTLSFDTSTFQSAFNTQYNAVQALFDEQLTSTSTSLNAVSGGGSSGGTYDVNVTALPTAATWSTAGFGGTYDDGGTADTVTLTDTARNKSAQVTLTAGMTTSDIVAAFQSAITANGLGINVSANGNDIAFTQQTASSSAGITISSTGTDDGTGTIWSTGTATAGTDIQGTIGGEAATGSGSVLVGNTGTDVAGVTVSYAGTTTGDAGSVTVSQGAMTSLDQILDTYLDAGSGLFDQRNDQLTSTTSSLTDRINQMNERLTNERAMLVAKYAAMEAAVAALKDSAASLLGSSIESSTTPTSSGSTGTSS